MGDGRSKETQRGLGTPHSVDARSEARTEPTVGHLVVVSPGAGTPIVLAASESKPSNARSTGTDAAVAYVEPKTPPPVRAQRSDTVAVLLSDDIDPQKVPTEPSLSRRRELSQWSDISRLPQVKYKSGDGALRWFLVAAFGGIVGYWVYWGASRGSAPAETSPSSAHGKVIGAAVVVPAEQVSGVAEQIPANTVAAAAQSERSVTGAPSVVSAQPVGAATDTEARATKSTAQAGRPTVKPTNPGAKASAPAESKPANSSAPKGSEIWLQ